MGFAKAVFWTLTAAVALGGCKKTPPDNLPVHTLVYGGDVTMGRRSNVALFDDKAQAKMLGELAPLFKGADIALANAEGVIAEGGRFTDKGEPRPHMYRASPAAIDLLKSVGMDVVSVGNNHSGDYGPAAYIEMLDRLTAAGIGYTGGGENLKDAKTPYYQKVGDTVVAIVGGDITITAPVRALENRAGPLYFGMHMHSEASESKELIATLKEILKEARKHAHVVLFTPHWGDNWVTEPTSAVRTTARAIIRLGYDGILGHSAHLFQGAELIDGKPVIYDAGNVLLDYGGGDDAHRGVLWELSFTRAGITQISGHPIWMEANRSMPAEGKIKKHILNELKKRSEALGTEMNIEDDMAVVLCNPRNIEGPSKAPAPPVRTVDKIRKAPSDLIVDKLPEDATPVDVRYDNGVRLVGYQLLVKDHSVPKSGQFVILYWTADKPVKEGFTVHLEARWTHPKTGEVKKNFSSHLPGDWIFPAEKWPVGKIIKDWTLFRLNFRPPSGEVNFYTGMHQKKLIVPESANVELVDKALVHIGRSAYLKGAKNIFEYLKQYETKKGELGVYH
jgi:poly-gamma-glutamate capsule biosynthesis protein CapA/YwtB (metallophosphatase superfamily)